MKILIVTKNWLGDVLFEFPAIEMIRQQYPEAEIVCLAPERCREILEANPAIHRVIVFDERREHRSLLSRIRFVRQLRKEIWDQAYLFHRSRTRAFLLLLAGVKERIGYGTKRSWFLTKSFPEPQTPIHHVDYFLELLRRAGIPCRENIPYHFYYSDDDRQRALRLLEKHGLEDFVCFHLSANWGPKRWPPVHFAKLADLIYLRFGLKIVLTGTAQDLFLAEEMMRNVRRARVISLVGETKLGELGAIFKRAIFLVSGDSGPMHMAHGVGTPVVALFGPTHPDLTGPRGTADKIILSYIPEGYTSPWYEKKLPPDGWLSHIQPEEVMQAIEKKDWIRLRGIPPEKEIREPAAQPPLKFKLNRPVNNILLVTLSNIGDVILTTPVMMTLALQFPDARLTVVAGPRSRALLEKSRHIDRLVVYDKQAALRGKWNFLKELRRESYDWVIDLRNTAIPYLVRAKKRSPLFRRFHYRSKRERNLEVLKMMGLELKTDLPPFDFFHVSDEE
ncbi:MAG: lipopolysaccharide heptosyltransferase II, partial [Candidatus Omnitrophica bacterium]|nr:lipopolysaccharide heptosyltransferase II [Candidatus Omnitrophota bacterium]